MSTAILADVEDAGALRAWGAFFAFLTLEEARPYDGPNYIPFIPRGLLKRYMKDPARIKEPRLRSLTHAVVGFFVPL